MTERLLRVRLVTSWGEICGIANHSAELIEAVQAADRSIEVVPSAASLDPTVLTTLNYDLLHLNYHRALHSRWTPTVVQNWKTVYQKPVVITFHDTFGEHEPDELTKELCEVADAFIVHEPCLGLEKALYWSMGVPPPLPGRGEHGHLDYPEDHLYAVGRENRPILGTVGFDFPWKCWPQLCEVAESAGWGVLICTPKMSQERFNELHAKNPWLTVHQELTRSGVARALRSCDATAFTFVNNNSGQSASILQGIAARKPVIALQTCRQFRALYADPLGGATINWCTDFEAVARVLRYTCCGRLNPGIVGLAEQDSWTKLGAKYAALHRQLVEARA